MSWCCQRGHVYVLARGMKCERCGKTQSEVLAERAAEDAAKPKPPAFRLRAAIDALGPLDRDRVVEVLRMTGSLADRFAGDAPARRKVYELLAELVENGA